MSHIPHTNDRCKHTNSRREYVHHKIGLRSEPSGMPQRPGELQKSGRRATALTSCSERRDEQRRGQRREPRWGVHAPTGLTLVRCPPPASSTRAAPSRHAGVAESRAPRSGAVPGGGGGGGGTMTPHNASTMHTQVPCPREEEERRPQYPCAGCTSLGGRARGFVAARPLRTPVSWATTAAATVTPAASPAAPTDRRA